MKITIGGAKRSKTPLGVTIAVVAALALAGCSSSNNNARASGSSSGASNFDPAPFQKIVDAAAAPSKFPELPASPPVAKGKSVVLVSGALSGSGNAIIAKNVQAAAQALGWPIKVIDTQSDPAKIVSSMAQAVTLKPDAILLNSLPAEQTTEPIAKARAEGVPVLCVACGYLKSNQNPPKDGLNYEVLWDFGLQGAITASRIVLHSKGQAQVLMLEDPEFASTRPRIAEAHKVFDQCSGCHVVKSISFNIGDVSGSLPAQVKAALQANPQINYVWAPWDDPAMVANNAIQQLGLGGKVFTTGIDANAPNIENILAGGSQIGDNVVPLAWIAYALVDNTNRLFNGAPMLDDNLIPSVLVTKENAEGWQNFGTGDINIATGYKALWGVS